MLRPLGRAEPVTLPARGARPSTAHRRGDAGQHRLQDRPAGRASKSPSSRCPSCRGPCRWPTPAPSTCRWSARCRRPARPRSSSSATSPRSSAPSTCRSPQVTVYVKEYNSQRVTIEGAVKKPGVYPIRGKSIAAAVHRHGRGLDPTCRFDGGRVQDRRTASARRRSSTSTTSAAVTNARSGDPIRRRDRVPAPRRSRRRSTTS